MGLQCPQIQIRIQTQSHVKGPERVLTVNLGQYKLKAMLDECQTFILAKNLFLALPGFLENCVCVLIIAVQLRGCAQM